MAFSELVRVQLSSSIQKPVPFSTSWSAGGAAATSSCEVPPVQTVAGTAVVEVMDGFGFTAST